MGMDAHMDHGALVLADISGFTAFVTATELEHGTLIIAELLEEVMRRLSPPLEIQEIEGKSSPIGCSRISSSSPAPTSCSPSRPFARPGSTRRERAWSRTWSATSTWARSAAS
jgi:hypothetical protein